MCRVSPSLDTNRVEANSDMSDFVIFYFSGGLFNHLVTIGLGFAGGAIVMHARSRGREDAARWLALADRALLACVGLGLLGTLLGFTDLSALLAEIPTDQFLPVAARGGGLAIVPLTWSLLGAVPLALVVGARRLRDSQPERRSA